MKPEELREGDEFVQEDTGRVFWTSLETAGPAVGGEVCVVVRYPDGGRGVRFLPVGADLTIRRNGKIVTG